jgi:hypothetical protein
MRAGCRPGHRYGSPESPSGILVVPCRCQKGNRAPPIPAVCLGGLDVQEELLPITGLPAGADDPALEQARLAQLAPHAYLDGWRGRHALAAGVGAPPSSTPEGTLAMAPTAARVESISARPGLVRTRVGDRGVPATNEALPTVSPKPVPPPRTSEQRKAALDAARQRNAALKALRARLQAGQLTLAELLAQAALGDQAAARMQVRTSLMALPGIRSARASQLMTQPGIDGGRRAGALSTSQVGRLLAAVAAMNAELAARRDRRHHSGQ